MEAPYSSMPQFPPTINRLFLQMVLFIAFQDAITGQEFIRSENPVFNENKYPSSTSAWGDYDNDGYIDVYVTVGERTPQNYIYRNLGNGEFEFIRNELTINETDFREGAAWGACWGDYDNDGFLDLYVSHGSYESTLGIVDHLFHNQGDGTYQRLIVDDRRYSLGSSWVDIDNNGFLDIFSPVYGDANVIYEQHNGQFHVNDSTNLSNEDQSNISGIWCDYNNDGWMDVYLVNPLGRDELWLNAQGDSFTHDKWTILTDTYTRSVSWGDYNNDGWMDLAIADLTYGIRILKNDSAKVLEIQDGLVDANVPSKGRWVSGTLWQDFDNDGYLDLLLTQDIWSDNMIFMNDGNGGFNPVQNELTKTNGKLPYGISSADVNKDGLMDVFLPMRQYKAPFDFAEDDLFLNITKNCNNFIRIGLEGIQTNRTGIGTRVVIHHDKDGKQLLQTRQMIPFSGGNYSGQSEMILHFGLGEAEHIDSIEVFWPSGNFCLLENIDVNGEITIKEDCTYAYDSLRLELETDLIINCEIGQVNILARNARIENEWSLIQNGNEVAKFQNTRQFSAEIQLEDLEIVYSDLCKTQNFTVDHISQKSSIYPNPSSGIVYVDLNTRIDEEIQIRAFDLRGKRLGSINYSIAPGTNQSKLELDMTNVASGIYVLDVIRSCSRERFKVIIVNDG